MLRYIQLFHPKRGGTMPEIKTFHVAGDLNDVGAVLENFGSIQTLFSLDNSFTNPIEFKVRRFTNWYKDSSGRSPLYFLIPSEVIECVWPDDISRYSDIRYGTNRFCCGMAFHLPDRTGLYICLSPQGANLVDDASLGI